MALGMMGTLSLPDSELGSKLLSKCCMPERVAQRNPRCGEYRRLADRIYGRETGESSHTTILVTILARQCGGVCSELTRAEGASQVKI